MRALLVAGLLLAGCGGATSGDLRATLQEYNKRVRWQAWQRAALHVDPAYRAAWMQQRVGAGAVSLTDLQVVGVQPGKDDDEMIVHVAVGWYREPEMTVRTRVWTQTWRLTDGDWMLMAEEVAKVAPANPEAPPAPAWP